MIFPRVKDRIMSEKKSYFLTAQLLKFLKCYFTPVYLNPVLSEFSNPKKSRPGGRYMTKDTLSFVM